MITDEQNAKLTAQCQEQLEALAVAYDSKQRQLVAALERAQRLEQLLGMSEEESRG